MEETPDKTVNLKERQRLDDVELVVGRESVTPSEVSSSDLPPADLLPRRTLDVLNEVENVRRSFLEESTNSVDDARKNVLNAPVNSEWTSLLFAFAIGVFFVGSAVLFWLSFSSNPFAPSATRLSQTMAVCIPLVMLFASHVLSKTARFFEIRGQLLLAEIFFVLPSNMITLLHEIKNLPDLAEIKLYDFFIRTGKLAKANSVMRSCSKKLSPGADMLVKAALFTSSRAAIASKLGDRQSALRYIDEAQDYFARGTALGVTGLDVIAAEYFCNFGVAYEYLQDASNSLCNFEYALKAAQGNPRDVNILITTIINVGAVYLQSRNLEHAQACLQSALDITEKYANCDPGAMLLLYTRMAQLKILESNFEDAEKFLEKAQKLAESNKESWFAAQVWHARAELQTKQGQRVEAQKSLDVAERMLRRSGAHLKNDSSTSRAIVPEEIENKFFNLRKAWLPLSLLLAGALLGPIIGGLRAAEWLDYFFCQLFVVVIFIPISMVYLPRLAQSRLTHKLRDAKRTPCMVSFKQLDYDANSSTQVFEVSLGEPFQTKRVVKNDFNILQYQNCKYAQPGTYEVLVSRSDEPVAIATWDGLIELGDDACLWQSAASIRSKNFSATLTCVAVGFALIMGSLVYAFHLELNHPATKLPADFTAYEYYRFGVKRASGIFDRTRPASLQLSHEALDKASELDKNGVIGDLARCYKRSHLLTYVSSKDILEKFDDAETALKKNSPQAKTLLEDCIKTDPKFLWSYTALAELLVREKDLSGAKDALDKAAALNNRDARYLVALARYDAASGKPDQVLSLAQEVFADDPLNPGTSISMLFFDKSN